MHGGLFYGKGDKGQCGGIHLEVESQLMAENSKRKVSKKAAATETVRKNETQKWDTERAPTLTCSCGSMTGLYDLLIRPPNDWYRNIESQGKDGRVKKSAGDSRSSVSSADTITCRQSEPGPTSGPREE